MNIYLVRNKDGQYLNNEFHNIITWGARDKATPYSDRMLAVGIGARFFQHAAREKFDIVHLVATAKVDKSQYPKTLDGVAIELGKTYYRLCGSSVIDVYADEVCVQMSGDGVIEYLRIREDCRAWNEARWYYSGDLYSTPALAQAALQEEWDI